MRTPLCDLVGIEHPVIQGPTGGPWEIGADLVAAVSTAGGLGSIATSLRSPEQVRDEIRRVRERSDGRPFAVNVTRRPFDDDVFEAALAERPAVISLALGSPGDLVDRAHAAGCLFIEQVTTVTQAREAAEAGVDAVIAQGAREAVSAARSGRSRWCRRWWTQSRRSRSSPPAESRTAAASQLRSCWEPPA